MSLTSRTVPASRLARADAMARLRARLPIVPEAGIPDIAVLDDSLQEELRQYGRGVVSYTVMVAQYDVLREPRHVEPSLDIAVLLACASQLRDTVRTTDLVLFWPPDSLLVVSPGAESMEAQGMIARLDSLFQGKRLSIGDGEVRLSPRVSQTN